MRILVIHPGAELWHVYLVIRLCMQLSLINTTIICIHPAPQVEAVGPSRFHPPVGVLIALCILSPLVTAAVTLWVWALPHACWLSCVCSWLRDRVVCAVKWTLVSCAGGPLPVMTDQVHFDNHHHSISPGQATTEPGLDTRQPQIQAHSY